MKIIRVFPRRTPLTPVDDMTFIGYRMARRKNKTVWIQNPLPLDKPAADEVHVSCTFTWDRERAEKLVAAWSQFYPVRLGGPAIAHEDDSFTPGRYVADGVTFTSRGCNNGCPWCLVSKTEGTLREISIAPGHIVQDNNILQCNRQHRAEVYQMLKTQRRIKFSGGFEVQLFTEWDADNLRSLSIKELYFGADDKSDIPYLIKARDLLQRPSRNMLRAYVILAFDGQTLDQAKEHLAAVWAAGFMPHAQLFQPADRLIEYPPEWLALQRRWQRPAIMKTMDGTDTVI